MKEYVIVLYGKRGYARNNRFSGYHTGEYLPLEDMMHHEDADDPRDVPGVIVYTDEETAKQDLWQLKLAHPYVMKAEIKELSPR